MKSSLGPRHAVTLALLAHAAAHRHADAGDTPMPGKKTDDVLWFHTISSLMVPSTSRTATPNTPLPSTSRSSTYVLTPDGSRGGASPLDTDASKAQDATLAFPDNRVGAYRVTLCAGGVSAVCHV